MAAVGGVEPAAAHAADAAGPRPATGRIGTGPANAVLIALAILTITASLGLSVNPWSRDGWFQTQYMLVGHFTGYDDYTPIAAPALFYAFAHGVARALGLGLAGELYVAAVLQNLLLLISACFLYRALRLMGLRHLAGVSVVAFLLFALSTGVAHWFYSEAQCLFLMAGVTLSVVTLLYGGAATPRRFWVLALTCAVLVGLLVATRITPIVLIPGIALLLLGQLPLRQVAALTGASVAVTAVMLGGMILANHARFGRYEITNASGRHLWQGVKDFSDRALSGSPRYEALKRIDPHVQGTYWDEIPPTDYDVRHADPREPLLGALAREAIRRAPVLYLEQGVRKFVRTIGVAPPRDAFYELPGVWNPLRLKRNLPALLDVMGAPPAVSAAISAAYLAAYDLFSWLYPISIFVIAMSCLAVILTRVGARAGGRSPRAAVVAFYTVGMPLALLPIVQFAERAEGITATCLCAVMLGWAAAILERRLRAQGVEGRGGTQRNGGRLETRARILLFAAAILFGTLWFTWQVEVANARYVLPFLPFWSVMLAISIRYWGEPALASSRARAPLGAAPPSAA